jgi:hypothetical protein
MFRGFEEGRISIDMRDIHHYDEVSLEP